MLKQKRLFNMWIGAAGLYFMIVVFFCVFKIFAFQFHTQPEELHIRHLLMAPMEKNCSPAAIEEFPKPLMKQQLRIKGTIVVHFFTALYMFIGLSLICESYFVPSLEGFSNALQLSSDVAGATFMAAGSSAPELATTIIGVFVTKSDIGVGAVIGSAVFNVMFVVSCCGLFAQSILYLSWWSLCRDCFFYMISIIALILVMYDRQIHWYEAVVFLALYVVYILFMYINPKAEKWFKEKVAKINCKKQTNLQEEGKTNQIANQQNMSLEQNKQASNGIYELKEIKNEDKPQNKDLENGGGILENHKDIPENDSETFESPFKCPECWWKRLWWIFTLPLQILIFITVPRIKPTSCKYMYILTFFLSILWIAIFSYIMVWMIAIIGFTIGIPDNIMGLTFLAAGISIPDVISSIIVVKKGFGNMSVAHAIGSNVFDILLCLGLPWLIQSLVIGPNNFINVRSEGLTYCAITLLSSVALLLIITHLNKWRLDRRLGIILMVVYVLFTILACLYEMNIFGFKNVPVCPTDF